MLKILRKGWTLLLSLTFISFFGLLLPNLFSYTNSQLIDLAYQKEFKLFLTTLIVWFVIMVADHLVDLLVILIETPFERGLNNELVNLAFNRLKNLEEEVFNIDFSRSHRIFSIEFKLVFDYIKNSFFLIKDTVKILLNLVLLIIFNYIFGIGALVLITTMLLLTFFFSGRFSKLGREMVNINSLYLSKHTNLIEGFDILARSSRSLALVEANNKIWNSTKRKISLNWAKNSFFGSLNGSIFLIFNLLIITTALFFVYMGYFSLGYLVYVRALASSGLDAGLSVIDKFSTTSRSREIVRDFIRGARRGEKRAKAKTNRLETLKQLVIKEVSFKYKDSSTKPLESFNLQLKRGEKIIITGKSGLGKTTISRLLLNYIKPISGEIYWNKTSYSKLTSYDIREKIAYISGSFKVFEGSVRDNLLLGRVGIEQQRLLDTLTLLGLKEFDLEERISSESISSGQNQRFIIARELLAPRDVIIFDEAMSNIDFKNRTKIEEILFGNKELTFINITHHLETKDRYERMIDLD